MQDLGKKGGSVVVAIDFSDDAQAALVWAAKFAGRFKSKLIVLHVVHDPADAPGYYKTDKKDLLRPMEAVAERMMGEFIDKSIAAYPALTILNRAKSVLVKGLPATRILEVAQKKNARLIVVGSRGRTGLAHILIGSTAERVVQLSEIPVTVVKTPKAPPDTLSKS